MPLGEWIQDHVVPPARMVIIDTPLGGEVSDLERLHGRDGLCSGIEGAFGGLVRYEYAPWPPESTTDGLVADLCIRSGLCGLEFVGMCFIDFSGERFPLRVEIELSADLAELVLFSAHIGNADAHTAAPPRLPESSMILPERDENGHRPVPHLLLKHRLVPIEWTLAFSITQAGIAEYS